MAAEDLQTSLRSNQFDSSTNNKQNELYSKPLINKTNSNSYNTSQDPMKRLKLRIINEPLTFKSNHCANCCVCCIDFVDPLSKQERIIKLTIGYIRKYSIYHISSDIYSICIDYVGNAETFDHLQLLSSKEMATIRRQKCLKKVYIAMDVKDICSDDLAIDACLGPLQLFERCNCYGDCCKIFCFAWFVLIRLLCVIGLFIGKDIALLVININNDCNYNDSKYILFDLNIWIMIGSIAHLVYSLFYCLQNYLCCNMGENRYREKKVWHVIFIFMYGFTYCFFIAWMVIGFLFYSEMSSSSSTSNKQCMVAVLSWCILQAVESVLAPIFVCCLVTIYDVFES